MGEKDTNRVKMVQFHQSYSYEDFIMGFRPTETGFELKKGVFYEFCRKAAEDDRPYFFIIDEINRGNLSKIFGELFRCGAPAKQQKRDDRPCHNKNNDGFSGFPTHLIFSFSSTSGICKEFYNIFPENQSVFNRFL